MERTLEHVEQPELAGRPPEGGHREVVLEHDDVRRLLGKDSMELNLSISFCHLWTTNDYIQRPHIWQ